jgi:nucleoside 2-deoxyribosyltransferase
MKFYLAGRFSRRHILNGWANDLQSLGHTITSRWVLPDSDHITPAGMSEQAEDEERERFAVEDIEDIIACDCCISLTEPPRNNSRGGRHVEFGIAAALKKKLIVIGLGKPCSTTYLQLSTSKAGCTASIT